MKVKITKVPSLFKQGGGIHIKPSHEGLFTQKANRHGMGVQQFASHVLANKEDYPTSTVRLANFARNASKWNAYGGSILYADGGQFEGSHTHGVDFKGQGDFTEFNTGSSHEMNGNEGILQGHDWQGTPNLVEEGETKFDDYIFSTRLTIPTRKELDKELKSLPENEGGDSQRGWEISVLKKWAGKTYAYASKHAYREAEERPNDPYSNETLDEILEVLKNSLEKQRAIEQSKKEAKEELKQLELMSDKEYADAKEQLEAQEEAQMQQALLQQALAELQALMEQLMQQMSPEELLAYMQLMQLQQAMQQAPLGYAEGGDIKKPKAPWYSSLPGAKYNTNTGTWMAPWETDSYGGGSSAGGGAGRSFDVGDLSKHKTFNEAFDAARDILKSKGINEDNGVFKYGKNTYHTMKTSNSIREQDNRRVGNSTTRQQLDEGTYEHLPAVLKGSTLTTFAPVYNPDTDKRVNVGNIKADGGLLSEEEAVAQLLLIASYYYLYLQEANDTNKILAILLRMALYALLIQQLPLEQQLAAALQALLQCLYEAAMLDADFVNQLNLASQAQLYAEGGDMLESDVTDTPMMEEGTHEEMTGINPTLDVEEMSTSLLNETIDLIYQWAKLNGIKELARRARKAKKMSREDKEDFVDEALEEVDLVRAQQQEELKVLEQLALELMSPEALMQLELLMTQELLSEALAAQELNALMQLSLLFARGGNLFATAGYLKSYKKKDDITTHLPWLKEMYGDTYDLLFDELNNIIATKGDNRGLYDPNGAYMKALANFTEDNWNKLTDEQKAEFVDNLVRINPDVYKGYTVDNIGKDKWNFENLRNLAQDGFVGGHHLTVKYFNDALNSTEGSSNGSGEVGVGAGTAGETGKAQNSIKNYLVGQGNPNWNKEESEVFTDIPRAELVTADVPKGYKLDPSKTKTIGNTTYNFYNPYDLENRYFTKEGFDYRDTLNARQRALFDLNPTRYLELQGLTVGSGNDEYDDDNGIKRTTYIIGKGNDPIPKYNNLGDYSALATTGLGLLHNLISPVDLSAYNDTMALMNRAGLYSTIIPELINGYIGPRRFDRNYWATKAQEANAARLAGIVNSSAGNRAMANALGLVANKLYYDALGDSYIKGEDWNAGLELKEAEHNTKIDMANQQAINQAALANQRAYDSSWQRRGDYFTKAITWREAAKAARDATINQGMSLMAQGVDTLYKDKWQHDFLRWNALYNGLPGLGYWYTGNNKTTKNQ